MKRILPFIAMLLFFAACGLQTEGSRIDGLGADVNMPATVLIDNAGNENTQTTTLNGNAANENSQTIISSDNEANDDTQTTTPNDNAQTITSSDNAANQNAQTTTSSDNAANQNAQTTTPKGNTANQNTQTTTPTDNAANQNTQTTTPIDNAANENSLTTMPNGNAANDNAQTATKSDNAVNDNSLTITPNDNAVNDNSPTTTSSNNTVTENSQSTTSPGNAANQNTQTTTLTDNAANNTAPSPTGEAASRASSSGDASSGKPANTVSSGATPPTESLPIAATATSPAPAWNERLGFQGGNINSGGYICDGGDGYVYYRSEKADIDSWTLYKARYNGTGKTKLSSLQPQRINVLDGWVYFISDNSGSYAVNRVRTDGSEEQYLADSAYGGLFVAESGIYFDVFNAEGTMDVARMDLDGGNLRTLIPNAGIKYYFEGKIYYTNADGLSVFTPSTGRSSLLTESHTHNLSVDGTGIYYWSVNRNGFVRRDFSSGAETVLVTGSEYYSYTGGYLYYLGQQPKYWPGQAILRLDTATGETNVLFESTGEYFNASGEWLGLFVGGSLSEADPALLDQYGGVKGYTESAGEVYSCGGHVYMRGTLRDSSLKKGMPLCIARLDNGVVFWD
jgi:hypothetical protein